MERKSREEMAVKRHEIQEGSWPPMSFIQTGETIISPSSFMQTHQGMSAHQTALELTKLNAARMMEQVQNSDSMKEWDADIHAKFQAMKDQLHQMTKNRKHDNEMAASSLMQTRDQDHFQSFAETEELESQDIAEMNAFKERNLAEISAMRDGHKSVREAIALAAQTQAGAAVQAAADNAAHAAAQPSSFLEEGAYSTEALAARFPQAGVGDGPHSRWNKINAELAALQGKLHDESLLEESPDDSLLEQKSSSKSKENALVAKFMADFHAGFKNGLAKQTTPAPDALSSFLEAPDDAQPSAEEKAAAEKGIEALQAIGDESGAETRTENAMQESREKYVKKMAHMVGSQNLAPALQEELGRDLQRDQKVRDVLHRQLRNAGD